MAALLADTLDTLEVSFDVPTNMAAMQQGLLLECGHLFQTDTLTLLLGGAGKVASHVASAHATSTAPLTGHPGCPY